MGADIVNERTISTIKIYKRVIMIILQNNNYISYNYLFPNSL